MSLQNAPVAAILPAVDLEKAEDFYSQKLGLKLTGKQVADTLMFEAGKGTMLVVYKREEKTKAEHTVAGFMVEDLEVSMDQLKAKGVVFQDYDLPGLKTVDGVAEMDGAKSAWFKDPEGNILAINQM